MIAVIKLRLDMEVTSMDRSPTPAETDAGNRLVELVGEDVGFVWGDMGIDDEYDFTVFTDAVTVSNDE